MVKSIIVAPSLLAANAGCLAAEAQSVETAGAKFLHLDVMDGRYVPNLSFGPNILAGIRPASRLLFDVHLMIGQPEKHVQAFIDAGADSMTIHADSTGDLDGIRKACMRQKIKFGLAVSPWDDLESIWPYCDDLDLLLIMGIRPGFGGQRLLPETTERIRSAASLRLQSGGRYLINVDGGVNQGNAYDLMFAGADILVAGSAIFGQSDRNLAVRQLMYPVLPNCK